MKTYLNRKQAVKITIQFGQLRELDGNPELFKPFDETIWRGEISDEMMAQSKDDGVTEIKNLAAKIYLWATDPTIQQNEMESNKQPDGMHFMGADGKLYAIPVEEQP